MKIVKILQVEDSNSEEYFFYVKGSSFILYSFLSNQYSIRKNDSYDNTFYIPDFRDQNGNIHILNNELKEIYQKHVSILYRKYKELINKGIPEEEARYILPVSYLNDYIIKCNESELLGLITSLLNRKDIKEYHEMALNLIKLVKEEIPELYPILESKLHNQAEFPYNDEIINNTITYKEEKRDILEKEYGNDLLSRDYRTCISLIMKKYNMTYEAALSLTEGLMHNDSKFKIKIINYLIKNNDLDILKTFNYRFIYDLSLNAIDYMDKKNIVLPNITKINTNNYYVPKGIGEEEYNSIIDNNQNMIKYFVKEGIKEEDLIYFYLLCNRFTIINNISAKDLYEQSKIYCCEQVLPEVRETTIEMINKAKQVTEIIGDYFGPYCIIDGYCPRKNNCDKINDYLDEHKRLIEEYEKSIQKEQVILKKSR